MKETKETKHRSVIAVTVSMLLIPIIALTMIAVTMSISAMTDFTRAAEETLRNGAFIAAFSENVLAPAYDDTTQMPVLSQAELVAVVANALEQEQLSNTAAVVQTTAAGVDSHVQDGNVTYSITLPVSTFLDCGVDSAERLAAYTVERVGEVNVLKPLTIAVSPNLSDPDDELVTLRISELITVLVFDRKRDGERDTTTTVPPKTTVQPTIVQSTKETITVQTTKETTTSVSTQPVTRATQSTTTSHGKTTKSQDVTTCESTKQDTAIKLMEKATKKQEKMTLMYEEDNSPKTGEKNFLDSSN